VADQKNLSEDEQLLAQLGYKQELSRTWSGFSNFAISFSIICILSGGINYVFIIGGQAYPLDIFPGHATHSTFGDGQLQAYAPSVPELVLGGGGLAVAFLITVVGVRVLRFLPQDELRATPAAAGAE